MDIESDFDRIMAEQRPRDFAISQAQAGNEGETFQRSSNDSGGEPITIPGNSYQERRSGRTSQQRDGLVPFEGPYNRPHHRTRFQEDPLIEHRFSNLPGEHSNPDPDRRRSSSFDWDREARRRMSSRAGKYSGFDMDQEARRRASNRYRSYRDYHAPPLDYDRDLDSGYEDYYGDRRGIMYGHRRRPQKSYRGRPKYDGVSDSHEDEPSKEKKEGDSNADVPLRLPLTMWMNSNLKNHFVALLGEFVGTTMFLFFAFAGTQVANINAKAGAQNSTSGGATGFDPTVLLYISLVFGFSLMVNVWVFFRISGGLFNPAVTLAMVLVQNLPIFRAFLLLAAQIAGSILASLLVKVLFPTPLNVRTTLSPGVSIAQGVFIEAILTAELVFTIFMLAKEKHKATFIAPVGIGLALFVAELVGVFYTGGSLNPARSLGPCIITKTFDQEHWVYWVGPGTGAVLAVLFYKFIKTLEYEMANPGQDGDPANDPTQNPNLEVKQEHEQKYGGV